MFELPELGYKYDALEPYIDAKTMEIHYSKHHQAYVTNLNNLIKGTEWQEASLEKILEDLNKMPENIRQGVRNNLGGHINHSLFWKLLKKPETSSNEPSLEFKKELEKSFGSYDKFLEALKLAGMSRFGSGWAWLYLNRKDKSLNIMSTPNQDSPFMEGHHPILGVDVWEHAYYLKHQNRRAEWLEDFLKVIDWSIVETMYKSLIK